MPPPASDGGADAPGADASPVVPNPFPIDPQGGEFAWVISIPGLREESIAVDTRGNVFVAAKQNGALVLDGVQLPAPERHDTLVVLKLTADGKAVWARSLGHRDSLHPRGVAATSHGDVVIGAGFYGRAQGPFGSFRQDDALVVMLDGETGETLWSIELTSTWDETVAGVATSTTPTGDEAIYVYGELARDTTISGQLVRAGAYLLRYDDAGALRWAQSFSGIDPGFANTLALDPVRGPVITGTLRANTTIGDQPFAANGAIVIGLDHDGSVRLTRQLQTTALSLSAEVAVARSGDIYLTSDVSSEILVGEQLISSSGFSQTVLIRLTETGHHRASVAISSDRGERFTHIVVDAAGASYTSIRCAGPVYVQPEVDCSAEPGTVIVSHGSDNTYHWATRVTARVTLAAAARLDRMIVAGTASRSETDFGGVRIPTSGLFIAALASGAARTPSPLPVPPRITSAVLDQIGDRQIRQGGTGILVIGGDALDGITSARLGDINVHVPLNVGNPSLLRLPVRIPHGHPTGPLSLTLGNAGGSTQLASVLTVTPIVVAPSGSETGRGTFESPMHLCRDWFTVARYGDVVLLQNGIHGCDRSLGFGAGVTLRGERKDDVIIRGARGSSRDFGGIFASGVIGTITLENLTIESASFSAISVGGLASISDVNIRDVRASGIRVSPGSVVNVTRYRYLRGTGNALVIDGAHVDARDVHVEDAFRGIVMSQGELTLVAAFLSSDDEAILAGNNDTSSGSRKLTISDSTLRSRSNTLSAALAHVHITGSSIESTSRAVVLEGGELTMSESIIRAANIGLETRRIPPGGGGAPNPLRDAVNLTLNRVEITSQVFGIYYRSDVLPGHFSLRNSRVQGGFEAVSLGGIFEADLGTAGSPGNNRLESHQGVALHDQRTTVGAPVDAHGTQLNGLLLEGEIVGPVTTETHHLEGPNLIRF